MIRNLFHNSISALQMPHQQEPGQATRPILDFHSANAAKAAESGHACVLVCSKLQRHGHLVHAIKSEEFTLVNFPEDQTDRVNQVEMP
jgi:hypothetical protein